MVRVERQVVDLAVDVVHVVGRRQDRGRGPDRSPVAAAEDQPRQIAPASPVAAGLQQSYGRLDAFAQGHRVRAVVQQVFGEERGVDPARQDERAGAIRPHPPHQPLRRRIVRRDDGKPDRLRGVLADVGPQRPVVGVFRRLVEDGGLVAAPAQRRGNHPDSQGILPVGLLGTRAARHDQEGLHGATTPGAEVRRCHASASASSASMQGKSLR